MFFPLQVAGQKLFSGYMKLKGVQIEFKLPLLKRRTFLNGRGGHTLLLAFSDLFSFLEFLFLMRPVIDISLLRKASFGLLWCLSMNRFPFSPGQFIRSILQSSKQRRHFSFL